MDKMRRERTWDWDINNKKTLEDPVYKESQRWLADRCVDFDYSNDARFETFRDFRKNKQLFQNHKDIAKDYDKKARFYRSCQKFYCSEWNRQIHNTQDRFSKLIGRTYAASHTKSPFLQYSYNKWVTRGKMTRDAETGWTAIQAVRACNNEDKIDDVDQTKETTGDSADKREEEGIRSVSVDNFVTRVHKTHAMVDLDGRDSRGSRSVLEIREIRRPVGLTRSTTELHLGQLHVAPRQQKAK